MNRAESAADDTFRESFTILGRDFTHAGSAAVRAKSLLKQIGFASEVIRRVAVVIYEAEMNVVMYAERATMSLEVRPKEIRITCADAGQGIEDVARAMEEGYSTAPKEFRDMGFGAGMGLPNIRRNSDEFHILSRPGVGTTIEVLILTGRG